MKHNKISFFMTIIYFSFSSIAVSQSVHFDELINRSALSYDKKQIEKLELYKIVNYTSTTDGSPFNINTNSQIDSVVLIKGTRGGGKDTVKYFYTYDSSGNVATEEIGNRGKTSKFYDANGNLTNSILKRWENNQLINSSQVTNIYDSSGRRTFHLYQQWDDTSWGNESRTEYFYNSHGDLASYLVKDWRNDEWVSAFRRTNTYDSTFILITSLFQNNLNGDWNIFSWRDSYFYDSNGNLIIQLSENLYSNKWVNGERYIYEYDKKDDMVFSIIEVWDDSTWIGYSRYNKSYNNNRKIVVSKKETWKSIKWVNSLQTTYFYNTTGDLSSAKTEQWSNNSWILGNGSMFIYDVDGNRRNYFGREVVIYYTSITDIVEEDLQVDGYSLSQNYPNPFNPSTVIRYNLPHGGVEVGDTRFVTLKIYNAIGQEVKLLVDNQQSAGSYEVVFDATTLSSGVYFYRLHVSVQGIYSVTSSNTNFSKTKKLILLK